MSAPTDKRGWKRESTRKGKLDFSAPSDETGWIERCRNKRNNAS